MCNEQAQKQYSGSGGAGGYVGGYAPLAQGIGLAGIGAGTGMVGGKASPDPMRMPLAELLQGYHGFRKEVDYLKIEVSRHKLRVAELEHEKALRIG